MRKFQFLLAILLTVAMMASAQVTSVTGTVTSSDDGEPIVGATVTVKGTKAVTVTDTNGKFRLSQGIGNGKTLVVTFIGMKTVEAALRPVMNIRMEPESTSMDEVIVVAFGKQKRESFTGSAGTLGAKDIAERQVSNPLSALDGKVAGVQMIEGNSPQSEPSIIVRGISSVNAGTSPLIVLDGMPYNGYYSDINPADVENISVLKDAASTALYGARGANGVILITTKQAKRGKAVISADAKWGVNTDGRVYYETIDNPGQYYETHYAALYNYYRRAMGMSPTAANRTANTNMGADAASGGLGMLTYSVPQGQLLIGENGKLNPNATPGYLVTNKGTEYLLMPDNWRDEALKNGLRQEYTVNVNGGNETFQAYASVGYLKNEGLVEGLEFERYSGRFKADWQAREWLRIGANVSYTHNESGNLGNSFNFAQTMPSIYPVYIRDANGNIMTDARGKMYDYGDGMVTGLTRPNGTQNNPLQSDWLNIYSTNSNAFGAQGYAEATFLNDFRLTANVSVYDTELRQSDGVNPYYEYFASQGGLLTMNHDRYYSVNAQQLLNWNHRFGQHNVSAMIGHEYTRQSATTLWGSKAGFISYNTHQELDGMKNSPSTGSNNNIYNVEGYMFRGMYDYADKYFASVSFRRDGSSRFHPAHRWGNFWSAGAAWIVTKEQWKLPKWVNMLKVKASIGQQGNDAIGDYYYTDNYTISVANGEGVLLFSSKGNRGITWETNTNMNAGVEFELFSRRLTGSVELYRRKTSDMLMWFNSPQSIGYSGYYDNVGDMLNSGVEVDLNAEIVRTKNVSWSINLNLTHNSNKVTSIPDENRTNSVDGKPGYVSGWHYVGEDCPINTWYLRKYAGVSADGQPMYYARNAETGETTTTTDWQEASMFLCGDPNAKIYGGFGTHLSAFGFDLSANFQYSIGGKSLDYLYQGMMSSPTAGVTGKVFHKDLLSAWSEDNPTSNIPRLQYNDIYTSMVSDRFLTDASYLAFKNISLGYTLPKSLTDKLQIQSLRIYVSCDNVAYWTKRKGFDPRSSLSGETDEYAFSPMRTVSAGLSLKF